MTWWNSHSCSLTVLPIDRPSWWLLGLFIINLVRARSDFAWIINQSTHLANVSWRVLVVLPHCINDWSQEPRRDRWHWHLLQTRVADSSSCSAWCNWTNYCDRIDVTHSAAGTVPHRCVKLRPMSVVCPWPRYLLLWFFQRSHRDESLRHCHRLGTLRHVTVVIHNVRISNCKAFKGRTFGDIVRART